MSIRASSIQSLLCDMVNIESVTGKENQLMSYLEDRFLELGLDLTKIEMDDGRYNLLASVGSGKPVLCLNAHADTVPPSGRSTPQCRVRKGTVYGLGSCDDKASIAAMTEALLQLREKDLNGRVDLLISVDEEISSRGVRQCHKKGCRCDYAIVGEPTDLQPVVAHSGQIFLDLIASGSGGHGSTPWKGKNAIETLFESYRRLEEVVSSFPSHPILGPPSTNLGMIRGGDAPNRIPDRCEAKVDVRVMPGTKPSTVENAIVNAVEVLGSTVRIWKRANPMETAKDSKLLTIVEQEARKVTKRDIQPVGFRGWTEADPFRNDIKADTLVFGPGSMDKAHSPDESVDLADVVDASRIYLETALQLVSHVD